MPLTDLEQDGVAVGRRWLDPRGWWIGYLYLAPWHLIGDLGTVDRAECERLSAGFTRAAERLRDAHDGRPTACDETLVELAGYIRAAILD